MDKRILVQPYGRVLFRNTKEQTNNTHNDMDTSQNNSRSERNQTSIYTVWFWLHSILENADHPSVTDSRSAVAGRGWRGGWWGQVETLGVTGIGGRELSSPWRWFHRCTRMLSCQIVHLLYVGLLHIKYTQQTVQKVFVCSSNLVLYGFWVSWHFFSRSDFEKSSMTFSS